ncbi:MAG TPA: exopolysaccharide biosynthesis polyprenyl glycosylphosphotransferase, partial [Myxococcota bacterium]|nr:exopolysaccharide biosynthesis polyprenyl glycosylphosphotransferase [Myxococcota bacterium]
FAWYGKDPGLAPWVVLGWVFGLHYGGMYQDFRRVRSDVLLLRFVRSSLVALGLLLVVDFLIQFDNRLSRTFLLSYFGLSTLGLWASRRMWVDWRKVWSREPVNILAIGLAEEAEPFLEILQKHSDWGLRIVGVLCPEDHADQSQMGGVPVLGKLSRLPQVLSERNIGQVFLTGRVWNDSILRFVADTCEEVGVTFSMDANFLGMGISRAEVQDYQGWSVLSFSTTPQDSEALSIKRGMDVVGAAAALVVSAPMLALVALLVKLEDGGPIFFSQERSGLYGRPFRMHKFRSMSVDAEAQKATLEQQNERSGPAFKIKNDPRVTRIGKFIRKYSLDEFPQFWNVLVGEMSLVGPRPPIPSEVVRYE